MDFASLFGGGGGAAPTGSPGIGGSGKGASGAATIFGANGGIGSSTLTPLIVGAGLVALAVVGFLVWLIVKK